LFRSPGWGVGRGRAAIGGREYNRVVQDHPQPSEPEAPSGPAQHRAPGADTRPRSRLAMLSIVLALGLSVLAFVLDFAWPLIVLAFVIAVVAALRIRPREQRRCPPAPAP